MKRLNISSTDAVLVLKADGGQDLYLPQQEPHAAIPEYCMLLAAFAIRVRSEGGSEFAASLIDWVNNQISEHKISGYGRKH
jgi:hypothetical protein